MEQAFQKDILFKMTGEKQKKRKKEKGKGKKHPQDCMFITSCPESFSRKKIK